jgi:hypothetical protein
MGVIYVVVPLDGEVAAWLDGLAIAHPAPSDNARGPSPREVFEALDRVGGLRAEVSRGEDGAEIDIRVEEVEGARWTTIRLSECAGDDRPSQLAFSKGWEDLIATIVEALAARCGPLVIVPDSGAEPTASSGRHREPADVATASTSFSVVQHVERGARSKLLCHSAHENSEISRARCAESR